MKVPFTPDEAPSTWSEVEWPEWVPEGVRDQIIQFWSEFGRGPRQWAENAAEPHTHPFGATLRTIKTQGGYPAPGLVGRWVHAWNNMGRLVLPDGSWVYPADFQCVSVPAEAAP